MSGWLSKKWIFGICGTSVYKPNALPVADPTASEHWGVYCQIPISIMDFNTVYSECSRYSEWKYSLHCYYHAVFVAFSSFLLPFDTRLLLFFATAMDRDRALQHLQDLMNEGGTSNAALSVLTPDNVQRSITPRLERRKARFKDPYFRQFTALHYGGRKLRT